MSRKQDSKSGAQYRAKAASAGRITGCTRSQVLVIGAGASGLMAAVMAARQGACVTVLEGQKSCGKKLLMTGNGKCNLTSLDRQLPCAYHSSEPEEARIFAGRLFSGFSVADTMRMFEQIGVPLYHRGDYVYPCSGQSSSVLGALLLELERLSVRIKCNEKVTDIHQSGRQWKVTTQGWSYEAPGLILSAGSKAVPSAGSDGSGYELAQSTGHTIAPVRPALTGLKAEDPLLTIASGARTIAKVKVMEKPAAGAGAVSEGEGRERENVLFEETGEVQWTAGGPSGIVIFNSSLYVSEILSRQKKAYLELDLLPPWSSDKTFETFARWAQSGPDIFRRRLHGCLNDRVMVHLEKKVRQSTPERAADPALWADLVKHVPVTVNGTRGFDQCQSCLGGVLLSEVDPRTCQSRLREGLYLTGEMLDAVGPCGGYNLQWAWSTGAVAGRAAALKSGHSS